MKILICGDSYCITDPLFPGLHWSEKLKVIFPDSEIHNLAYGGSSNNLIAMQLLQGLRFDPDFVIMSFTNEGRYEIDADLDAKPLDLSPKQVRSYLHERYTTNCWQIDPKVAKIIDRFRVNACSENFEKIKNYFAIVFCLMMLKSQNTDFCYSLGGFEYQQDYVSLLKSNYLDNLIAQFQSHELPMNLWYHGNLKVPCFHIDNERVHESFACKCIEMMPTSKPEIACSE